MCVQNFQTRKYNNSEKNNDIQTLIDNMGNHCKFNHFFFI